MLKWRAQGIVGTSQLSD